MFEIPQLRLLVDITNSCVQGPHRSGFLSMAAGLTLRSFAAEAAETHLQGAIDDLVTPGIGDWDRHEETPYERELVEAFVRLSGYFANTAEDSDTETASTLRQASEYVLASPLLGLFFEYLRSPAAVNAYEREASGYQSPKQRTSPGRHSVHNISAAHNRENLGAILNDWFSTSLPFVLAEHCIDAWWQARCADSDVKNIAVWAERSFNKARLPKSMGFEDPLYLLPFAITARETLNTRLWMLLSHPMEAVFEQTTKFKPFDGDLDTFIAEALLPAEIIERLGLCTKADQEIEQLLDEALPDEGKDVRNALRLVSAVTHSSSLRDGPLGAPLTTTINS